MSSEIMNQVSEKLPSRAVAVRVAASAGIIGVIAIAMPVLYYTFLSTLALAGIGIMVGCGIAVSMVAPLLSQKLELWVINQRLSAAEKDPIATRIAVAARDRTALSESITLNGQIESQLKASRKSMAEFKRQYPNEDVSDMETDINDIAMLHVEMTKQIEQNGADIAEYEARTDMIKARLKLAFGVEGMAKAINPNSMRKVYDKLLTETATDAVDDRLNSSRSALNQMVRQVQADRLLKAPDKA